MAAQAQGKNALNIKSQQQQHQLRVTKMSTTTTTTMTSTKLSGNTQQTAMSIQQASSQSTVTTARDELMPVQGEDLNEKEAINNSCVMLDESSDQTNTEEDDGDIEIGTESYDEEYDDEEIMYSDDDEDEEQEEEEEEEGDEEEQNVETAASAANNEDVFVDIDALDLEDPQLCATYVREIYSYLTYLEQKYRVSPDFLDKKVFR